jgi:hypothetical protein
MQYKRGIITLTPEKIRETIDTSAEDRLNWLEEANAFISKVYGTKRRVA